MLFNTVWLGSLLDFKFERIVSRFWGTPAVEDCEGMAFDMRSKSLQPIRYKKLPSTVLQRTAGAVNVSTVRFLEAFILVANSSLN